MKNTIYVLNTVAALGADASISNGVISVAGLQIPQKGILPSAARRPYVAGVSQTSQCVITAANSTTYGMTITSNSTVDGSPKTWTVPNFLSDASATATEIATVLRDAFNQFNDMPVTASLTGADLLLTADAPWYKFTAISNGAGAITTPVTVAAVNGIGLGSLITSQPGYAAALVTSTDQIEASSQYSTYVITYLDQANINDGTHQSADYSVLYLYVKETAANFASLCGEYGTLTMAIKGTSATWTAAGTVPTMSNGVITLGGGDIFYGNSDTNIGLYALDAMYITRTTATAYATFYKLATILSGTTANTPDTPNDLAAAAENAWYIHMESGL